MEPRWTEPYNLWVAYQEFLFFLIALMGSLACLAAVASLSFIWRECFTDFPRRAAADSGLSQQRRHRAAPRAKLISPLG